MYDDIFHRPVFESCLKLASAVNPGGDDLVPQAGKLGGHGEDVVIPRQPAPVPRQAPHRVRPAAGHHNLASVGILHHEVGSLGKVYNSVMGSWCHVVLIAMLTTVALVPKKSYPAVRAGQAASRSRAGGPSCITVTTLPACLR